MSISKYQEILDMEWPRENGRPRMSMEERAKIFMPFAALKGYEEAVEEQRRMSEEELRRLESGVPMEDEC